MPESVRRILRSPADWARDSARWLVAIVALVVPARPAIAPAGSNAWTQDAGPYGGRILCLLVHSSSPSKLVAGTEAGGLYVSGDGGQTWQSRSQGLGLLTVNDVQAVPLGTSTICVATNNGVYRSDNLGQSWTQRSGGLGSLLTTCLAIHPTNVARMLCGTVNGLYATADAGVSWTPVNAGLTNSSVERILWDVGGNAIYACTDGGAFLNTDPPGTWLPRSNGLSGLALFTRQLVTNPAASSELYLATYGGVFHSFSGGGSWELHSAGLTDTRAQALWIDPADGMHLLVGTESGVFETFDGALHWAAASAGLTDRVVRSLAYDGTSMLCGTFYRGVQRRTGSTWAPINQGLANTFLQEIAVDSSGSLIAAAGYGGVYRSADVGSSFALGDAGITVPDVRTVCFDPTNPQVVFAGANYGGVYKSTNGGTTFSLVGLAGETVRAIRVHPTNSLIVYAGTYDGVFRSDNGGGLWVARSAGMTADNVNDLELDPTNPEVIYAGIYLGYVYKTSNGGLSWTQKTNGLGASIVFDLAVDPADPQVVLAAGFEGKGIWRSADGGDTWHDASTGLPNKSIWKVKFDPFDASRAYAATQDGVARSLDGGATWADLSNGLLVKDVRDIAVDPLSFRTLRAATFGGGLYTFTDMATAAPPVRPAAAELHPGFPNPFNPSTTLAFELRGADARRVRLDVFDARGRRVRTLLDAPADPGVHRVTWDGRDDTGSGVAGGVYLARLAVDGQGAGVQKLTLLK